MKTFFKRIMVKCHKITNKKVCMYFTIPEPLLKVPFSSRNNRVIQVKQGWEMQWVTWWWLLLSRCVCDWSHNHVTLEHAHMGVSPAGTLARWKVANNLSWTCSSQALTWKPKVQRRADMLLRGSPGDLTLESCLIWCTAPLELCALASLCLGACGSDS